MNDSLLVWTAVAVVVLAAVILYCLWRLLLRRPARPALGRVDEFAGPDLEAARGRARAASVQRARQRDASAIRAAAPAANVGAVESVDARPSGIDADVHTAPVGAHATPVAGIRVGPDVSAGVGVATTAGPIFDAGIENLQYADHTYEDDGRR